MPKTVQAIERKERERERKTGRKIEIRERTMRTTRKQTWKSHAGRITPSRKRKGGEDMSEDNDGWRRTDGPIREPSSFNFLNATGYPDMTVDGFRLFLPGKFLNPEVLNHRVNASPAPFGHISGVGRRQQKTRGGGGKK